MTDLLRAQLLDSFVCTTNQCPDTCCKHWSMQVDAAMVERYRAKAPELMEAVEQAVEAPWIMRKDPQTGYCVKFEDGFCGIHKARGESYLGDACHFYPRVTRALGAQVVMTASTSCPEIARLMMEHQTPQALVSHTLERLPSDVKNYLPPELNEAQALAVHQAFMQLCEDDALDAEQAYARIANVARSLTYQPVKDWPNAVPLYLRIAASRVPAPQPKTEDAFNLLHALCGLVVASQKPCSPRLRETIATMESALAVTMDWQKVTIALSADAQDALHRVRAIWSEQGAARYARMLKRVLVMQLSLALFPFAGFGANTEERITIIGVRLATTKLALQCHYALHGEATTREDEVRIVQSIARFLDHLADASFSLQIFRETGWHEEPRMLGLLGVLPT